MKHKKAIFIIIAFAAVTYANSLFNGFVGDDGILITDNTFYRSFQNFSRLFDLRYIIVGPKVIFDPQPDLGPGSVSYRPASNATYFLDYALWKLNPSGYHLDNLLWHIGNCLLVYFLARFAFKINGSAILASLLFCVHPVNAEAVCNIGYRADLVAAFFFLLSFLCFIRLTESKGLKKTVLYLGSNVCFFLAIFSKESAIVLPALLMAYDGYFRHKEKLPPKLYLSRFLNTYISFVVIALFYLYLYFFVFKNSTLGAHAWGFSWPAHLAATFRIFAGYITALVFPWTIKVLPPFYALGVSSWHDDQAIFAFILFFLFAALMVKTFKKSKTVSFFLLWFILAFIPASNIIPIINPMAYRFVYLPAIGLFIVSAILIDKAVARFSAVRGREGLAMILKGGLIGLCVLLTVPLNGVFKSNYTLGLQLIENFPQSSTGYFLLAKGYMDARFYPKAKEILLQSLRFGASDSRIYDMLGTCDYKDNPDQAAAYFKKSIELNVYNSRAYFELGRLSIRQKDYEGAVFYLTKSVELSPGFADGYGYLADAYLKLGRRGEAEKILVEAERSAHDPKRIEYLRTILMKRPQNAGR